MTQAGVGPSARRRFLARTRRDRAALDSMSSRALGPTPAVNPADPRKNPTAASSSKRIKQPTSYRSCASPSNTHL